VSAAQRWVWGLAAGFGLWGGNLSKADAGCACGRWSAPPVNLNVCVRGPAGGCDDSMYAPVVRGTAARWDLFVDQWRTPLGALDQFGPRDALNSIAVLSRVAIAQRYGVGIPGGVIGVTFFEAQAGAPAGNSSCPLAANVRCPTFGDVANHDVDIALISDVRYTLDEEAAYLSQNGLAFPLVVSMRQVLLHELGHAHGMQHESRFPAVMNPSQLPFRGIDLTSDDVGAARAYLPMLATQVDDLAVMGFAFNAGAYQGAQVQGNAGLRAGVDVFTARRFTVFNRGDTATPGPVPYTFRVGGVVAGQGECPAIPAHGQCAVLQNQNVTVPLRAPAGDQAVTVEVDGWPGEPSPETNSVRIGTLSRVVAADLPPEPDAQVIDAQIIDAQIIDARVVDAQVIEARVVDAQIIDADVPIFPDFEVFDARFVPDASDGAVVVRVDGAVPVADAGPNTEAGSNTDAFAPTDADGAPDDAAAVDDAGHSGRDAGSPLRDAGRAVDAGPPQRDIDAGIVPLPAPACQCDQRGGAGGAAWLVAPLLARIGLRRRRAGRP